MNIYIFYYIINNILQLFIYDIHFLNGVKPLNNMIEMLFVEHLICQYYAKRFKQ